MTNRWNHKPFAPPNSSPDWLLALGRQSRPLTISSNHPAIFCFTANHFALKDGATALVAQLVEHLICNQGVTSSNLVGGTTFSLQFGWVFWHLRLCGVAEIPLAGLAAHSCRRPGAEAHVNVISAEIPPVDSRLVQSALASDVLVYPAILDDDDEILRGILDQPDIGQRITIDQQQIRQRAFLHHTELAFVRAAQS